MDGPGDAPALLGSALGAVALTLLDDDTTVWLTSSIAVSANVTEWLTFHTGVRQANSASEASFVIATPAELPDLATLALGTDEQPHCSATVLLDVRHANGTTRWRATGPGIDGSVDMEAPWAWGSFLDQWQANSKLFPRGVDLVLVDHCSVTALPRTTHLNLPLH